MSNGQARGMITGNQTKTLLEGLNSTVKYRLVIQQRSLTLCMVIVNTHPQHYTRRSDCYNCLQSAKFWFCFKRLLQVIHYARNFILEFM